MNDIQVTEIEMEEVCVEMDEATLMKEFDRLDAADGKADGQINKGCTSSLQWNISHSFCSFLYNGALKNVN